ncbi:MAG: IPT/TIG domain-containing protein [Acidobacteriota bacterium]
MMKPVLLSLVLLSAAAVAQPVVSAGGVIDGAGFNLGQAVAPGSLVSIFGTGLATSLLQGDTIPLSNNLGGTSVKFNGITAPLYFVSTGQINAQVPWDVLGQGATTGSVNVVVTVNSASSTPQPVPVSLFSPNMFSIPPGAGYGIAINPDGSLAAPVGAIPGFCTRPARTGEVLILLANGLGPVDKPIVSGAPGFDSVVGVRNTTTKPVVLIGGVSVDVAFSGLSPEFPGINQLNVVVPGSVSGNSVPLQLRTGGITSSDKVVIAVGGSGECPRAK